MFRAAVPQDSGCSCIPREQEFFLQSGSHRKYQFVNTKNFLCIGLQQQHLFDLLHDICGGSWSGNIPNAIPVYARQAACLRCQWRGKRLFISIRRQFTNRQLKTGERLKSINLSIGWPKIRYHIQSHLFYCMFPSGKFHGVWILCANVSEHSVFSIFIGGYEDGAECSETSAYKIQTPGDYPEESIKHSEYGEIWNKESFILFILFYFLILFYLFILLYFILFYLFILFCLILFILFYLILFTYFILFYLFILLILSYFIYLFILFYFILHNFFPFYPEYWWRRRRTSV